MNQLILLRHGQSVWNRDNRFTGWKDVDLSEKGVQEAKNAGLLLQTAGIQMEAAYTSVLKRAIRTLWIVLDEMDRMWVPVTRAWQLNERHYGALMGLNKAETAEKHGAEQVHKWRRGFRVFPPALDDDDPEHPKFDPRYGDLPTELLKTTESLELTMNRVIPYWENEIAPVIAKGRTILIAAHGNSLRALVKHLDNISDEEIMELEIPTGSPLIYELDDSLCALRHYYLEDKRSDIG